VVLDLHLSEECAGAHSTLVTSARSTVDVPQSKGAQRRRTWECHDASDVEEFLFQWCRNLGVVRSYQRMSVVERLRLG
jgi:hypothetical protein